LTLRQLQLRPAVVAHSGFSVGRRTFSSLKPAGCASLFDRQACRLPGGPGPGHVDDTLEAIQFQQTGRDRGAIPTAAKRHHLAAVDFTKPILQRWREDVPRGRHPALVEVLVAAHIQKGDACVGKQPGQRGRARRQCANASKQARLPKRGEQHVHRREDQQDAPGHAQIGTDLSAPTDAMTPIRMAASSASCDRARCVVVHSAVPLPQEGFRLNRIPIRKASGKTTEGGVAAQAPS